MIQTHKPIVIVDIDNTIADTNHRLKYLYPTDGAKKDWPRFFAEAENDDPIPHVLTMVDLLGRSGHYICLLTARPERERIGTERWLSKHGIAYDNLLMRLDNDFRKDSISKEEMFNRNLLEAKDQIVCAFEDRLHVAEMWRSLGIPVLLCNDEWRTS